jgi:2-amino-4-hydroxy-6-hydroxymethyldihydropteridine diphosphokinase
MPDVYVGVGSNEDAERKLRFAQAELQRAFGPARCSGVYRSAAVGVEAPDYLNMVIGIASDAGPDAVRAELRAIEGRAGRARPAPHAALVAVDLDLLLYGVRVDATRGLPHGDILRRAFVLGPLAELAPDLKHPLTGEAIEQTWDALRGRGASITRVAASYA